VQDIVVYADEPPIFFHYECPACGAKSEIQPTVVAEAAIQEMGYKDFRHFARERICEAVIHGYGDDTEAPRVEEG
jgi:hypothetical protein